jgi:hypothetical protein
MMNLRSRIVLIVTAVCLAFAGGVVVWKPWGGELPLDCGATTGMRGVAPRTVVAFFVPLIDRGRGDEPITLRTARLTREDGSGRFVGARLRKHSPALSPAVARWPDQEFDLSDQTTTPLEGYRVPRGEVTALYFKVQVTGTAPTRWSSPTITYEQGWRRYTATAPNCVFETSS